MKLRFAAAAAFALLAATAMPVVAEDKAPDDMSCDQIAAELSTLAAKPADDAVTARREALQAAANTKGCEV